VGADDGGSRRIPIRACCHQSIGGRGRGDDDGVVERAMNFLRSTLLLVAIVFLFALALFAVSARIWLPGDMAAPAYTG